MSEAQKQAEAAGKFHAEFGALINSALENGVPISVMVGALTNAEFELRTTLMNIRQQNLAVALSQKIVPAGGVHLPPSRNGHH